MMIRLGIIYTQGLPQLLNSEKIVLEVEGPRPIRLKSDLCSQEHKKAYGAKS